VHTKGHKPATTYLLNIPDLLAVVEAWHSLVSERLSPTDLWYAHISSDGTEFLPGMPPTDTRRSRVRKGMRQLCELAGVEYKRPHALRHGHAVWALSNAGSVADLKAVSQNLMHKSLFTTDEIYGMLTESDTRERVAGLAKKEGTDDGLSALVDQIAERVAEKLGL
jgi:integrase